MRKEAKQTRNITVERVHPYHCGDYQRKLVFSSDRPLEANEDYTLVSDGSLLPLIGIEVETQNWGISDKTIYANVLKGICFKTFHEELWKIERDGSLDTTCDSSAECITQPMTKAYIRNHYRDFKTMFEWFKALGIKCDETGDCGMHTHISNTFFGREKKTQDEAIRKFVYIVNRHYDLMRNLVYRRLDSDGSTFYFSRMPITMDEAKTLDLSSGWDNHHVCINLGHYEEGNIELRLVGGQKDFPCFRNTMESLFHILETVKRISWADCNDVVKVFSGCNQYVFDRLNTYVKESGNITEEQLSAIRQTVVRKDLI